jgi:hypothetical protein
MLRGDKRWKKGRIRFPHKYARTVHINVNALTIIFIVRVLKVLITPSGWETREVPVHQLTVSSKELNTL